MEAIITIINKPLITETIIVTGFDIPDFKQAIPIQEKTVKNPIRFFKVIN